MSDNKKGEDSGRNAPQNVTPIRSYNPRVGVSGEDNSIMRTQTAKSDMLFDGQDWAMMLGEGNAPFDGGAGQANRQSDNLMAPPFHG